MNTNARWLQIKELFRRCQQQPESEREAWLVAQCADDDSLLREVCGLLAAQRAAPGILGDGAVGVLKNLRSDEPAIDLIGRRIGSYRLLRLVGEGGMGSVFLAEREDGDFVQRVALKLVRADFVSAETRARFLRERNFLARLVHPHIAQLHDGGVAADGTPYFTLEYVEGESITRYCDARRLDVRQRLHLALQVCAAVAYAHRNLIVHRDLKPSNILITADGEAKLLDFGIAKLLDTQSGEGQTATQSRMMTPEYAAPEQILGETITTATDVYAIGVLLYELLCGRLPYARADAGTITWSKAVIEEAPEPFVRALNRPTGNSRTATGEAAATTRSTTLPLLRRTLRGDLDRIVQRALAKEPESRYPSVGALADDLRAFVDGRAISGSSRRYRLRKFMRRYWLPLVAAATIVLILIASGTAIVWQAHQTEQEAGKTAAVKDFLLELFRNANPNVAQGRQITLRDLVDRGVQRVDTIPPAQTELKAELQNVLGNIYYQLGLFKEAVALHEQAFAAVKSLPGDTLLAAEAERLQATEWASLGDNARAQVLADDAVLRLRTLAPPSAHDLARALSTAGWVAKKRADLVRSKQLSDEAFTLASKPPVDDELMYLALRQKGEFARLANDFAGAVDNYRQALAISIKRFGRDDEETIVTERLVGTSLNYLGQYDQAQPYLEAASDSSRRVFGEASGRTLRDQEMLAVNEIDRGNVVQAQQLLAKMLTVAEASVPRDESVLAEIRLNAGELNADMGKADLAERQLVQVRDFLRQQGGDEGELAETLNGLGNAHLVSGKLDAAESELREALASLTAAHVEDTSGVLAHLSRVLLQRGDVPGAREVGLQARDIGSKLSGEKSHAAANGHYSYAIALETAGQAGEAEAELRASLKSYALLLPPDGLHLFSAETRLTLGTVLAERAETREEGLRLLNQSVALREKFLGADHPYTKQARAALLEAQSLANQ